MQGTISRLTSRDATQLGITLARFRKQNEMTQAQLAELAGVLQKTVSTVERGDPGTQLRTLFKILAALDLELVVNGRGE